MTRAAWLLCALCLTAAYASAEPSVDYALECRGCHGADGAGPGG